MEGPSRVDGTSTRVVLHIDMDSYYTQVSAHATGLSVARVGLLSSALGPPRRLNRLLMLPEARCIQSVGYKQSGPRLPR